MRTIKLLMIAIIVTLSFGGVSSSFARATPKKVESGKTQVVAKAGGREITLSELRTEMANLKLSPSDPEAERIALDNVITRHLLAKEARNAELHRRPEAIIRMKAAQDQALADLYLSVASQPAEPTRREIETYIVDNPTLFSRRRRYEFSVLSLPTSDFDEPTLTPHFDETKDFSDLANVLRASKVSFAIDTASRPSTGFPEAIRLQLDKYSVGDNIVLMGAEHTQIMKISAVSKETIPSEEWPSIARRLLIQGASAERTQTLVDRIKNEGNITYYRKSAAPSLPESETASLNEAAK